MHLRHTVACSTSHGSMNAVRLRLVEAVLLGRTVEAQFKWTLNAQRDRYCIANPVGEVDGLRPVSVKIIYSCRCILDYAVCS